MENEAQERRARSEKILKEEGVPINDWLPFIETVSESTRRDTQEVAIRAMALCIVAAKGEGVDQDLIDQLVKSFDLASSFTPKERVFIENTNASQHDHIQFVWRYECYWVMLWALGFVDKLARPETICDVSVAIPLLRDNGRDGFLQKAKLRSQAEFLDAADLIYRYHWAIVDARINNREMPAGLEQGVVMERHYALNWLIGYQDQDWDDISTDT